MPLIKLKKHLIVKESDVTIITEEDKFIKVAINALLEGRRIIEQVIYDHPRFQTSFDPYRTTEAKTYEVISKMQDAAEICNVGPMAAVAGALADLMIDVMRNNGARITVVENGGEIAIDSVEDIHIALYSMTTALKAKMGFLFKGRSKCMGVGTSSGKFGHSISLGNADTVTIFAENASIGDAAATRVANGVKGPDIEGSVGKGLEIADSLEKVSGAFITRDKFVGKSGQIPELISIESGFEDKFIKSKLDDILPDEFRIF
jgi:hypothetical protein